ncbi:MAG: M42 family metallopeptidase [Gemmatimonadota bacterium]
MNKPTDFLTRLLDAPGPSGFELRASRVWREEAATFSDETRTLVTGSTVAAVNPSGRPRVMLAGHIDEIGLQVTHIDEKGYLYVSEIGGWDPQVLVGQRVRVLGAKGDVIGVIGKKPIHLMREEERGKASKTRELWVDVGGADRAAVTRMGLSVGDPMVVDAGLVPLAGDRIASRAIDNRIGAYTVLETLRLLSRKRKSLKACAMAVATTQEEIGYSGGGARTSAYDLEPDVALVVDVTFSTDVPDAEKKELGEHELGGGPVITRGSAVHPLVFERLVEVARKNRIKHTIQAAPRATRTDADGIYLVRKGVPTGLLSIPNRYMHSPNEVVSLKDVQATARLMAAFIESLTPKTSFIPE